MPLCWLAWGELAGPTGRETQAGVFMSFVQAPSLLAILLDQALRTQALLWGRREDFEL